MSAAVPHQQQARPRVAVVVAGLAVLGAVGSVVMVLLHVDLYRAGVVGVYVPAGFAAGALAFAAVAYGVWTRRAWGWPAAVAVNGIGFVASVFPWRGTQALAPAVVTLLALVILASRSGRMGLQRVHPPPRRTGGRP